MATQERDSSLQNKACWGFKNFEIKSISLE